MYHCSPIVEYFLVQFIEDSVKSIVTDSEIKREDDGITKAMYMDKRYYPCVVLSESGKFGKLSLR